MTATFPNSLRARPGVISLTDSGSGPVIRFRVEAQPVWDVVRVDAHASDSVRTAKVHALNVLIPNALFPDEFSVKLRGVEIFDESRSLADVGVEDGSTLLLAYRRRRPVR